MSSIADLPFSCEQADNFLLGGNNIRYVKSEQRNLGDSSQTFAFVAKYGQVEIELVDDVIIPHWFESAICKILDFGNLKPGWDSYNAKAIGIIAIMPALELLTEFARNGCPPPEIIPVPNGGIQFEWNKEYMGMEIEIISPTKVTAYYEFFETGEEWEGSMFPDGSHVWNALKFLKQNAG
jgi:hypothetical protein